MLSPCPDVIWLQIQKYEAIYGSLRPPSPAKVPRDHCEKACQTQLSPDAAHKRAIGNPSILDGGVLTRLKSPKDMELALTRLHADFVRRTHSGGTGQGQIQKRVGPSVADSESGHECENQLKTPSPAISCVGVGLGNTLVAAGRRVWDC